MHSGSVQIYTALERNEQQQQMTWRPSLWPESVSNVYDIWRQYLKNPRKILEN